MFLFLIGENLIGQRIAGRAEYEEVGNIELFEGAEPQERFPWLSTPGYGIGMIAGPRGSGKTLFLRKYALQHPIEINSLNKGSLEYIPLEGPEKPRAIVVDDVHYLLQAMWLRKVEGKATISEEGALKALAGFKDRAKELDAKLLFVSDEGPAGLYDLFESEENKRKFLELVYGCVVTGDDPNIFQKHLGRRPVSEDNALQFRNELSMEAAFKIKRQFRMRDVPILRWKPKYPPRDTRENERNRGLVYSVNYAHEDDKNTEVEYEDGTTRDSSASGLRFDELIAPIRQLSAINEEKGGVNRKTLQIDFGRPYERRGVASMRCEYTPGEVDRIAKLISNLYFGIRGGQEMAPLLRALLAEEPDRKEVRRAILNREMARE